MRTLTRALTLGASLLLVGSCDSLPGALEPTDPTPAQLVVTNGSAQVMEEIYVRGCESRNQSFERREAVQVAPGANWSGRFPTGRFCLLVVFGGSGGGWFGEVDLAASRRVTVSVFKQ
jgi:hypothetical protein